MGEPVSADRAWDLYVEALGIVVRAPRVRRERLDRLEEHIRHQMSQVDESLRAEVATRQELERRLGQVQGLANKLVTEHRVPTVGVAAPVRIPVPRDLRSALAVLDQVEVQLRSDVGQLEQARRMVPPPPPPPPDRPNRAVLYLAIAAAVLVLIIVIAVA
jgi:hypothetical protein